MLLPLFAGLVLAAPEDQVMLNSSGEFLHWMQDSVPFRVNVGNLEGLSADEVLAAVDAASSAWSGADDVHLGLERGDATDQFGGLDEQNTLYLNDDWTSSPDLLALTSSWSNEEGELAEFDLAVNTKHHAWSTMGAEGSVDLQNTLTHEMGHVMGIDHDDTHVEATMYPNSTLGETQKRDLYDSDLDVARWLYPERPASESVGSHSLFACSSVPPEGAWLSLPALFFLTRRRKESACS